MAAAPVAEPDPAGGPRSSPPSFLDALLRRCHFPPPGSPLSCAVSGGADSLALLVLATSAGCDVTAIHIDHGLRPESASESAIVAEAARRFGAQFRSERIALLPGPNLEARARSARYAALPVDAVTGHTADDLAETVLLNLLRGAGLDGLAGFDPTRRPIRRLRRHETVELCDLVGLHPVEDPTNHDPAFRRNRVRHELLPVLDAIAERDIALVLARQADLLGSDVALLETLAGEIDPTDARALAAAPPALARRAVRRWLRTGAEQHPPSAAVVERVLAVARGEAVGCEIGCGRSVRRRQGRLTLDG